MALYIGNYQAITPNCFRKCQDQSLTLNKRGHYIVKIDDYRVSLIEPIYVSTIGTTLQRTKFFMY